MKKKLTLTVTDDIIKAAKRKARRRGISVSQMFEEVFGQGEKNEIETESHRVPYLYRFNPSKVEMTLN